MPKRGSQGPPRAAVLIVTEQETEASHLAAALATAGLAPVRVNNQEAAINVLDQQPVDALITRLRSARIRGLQLIALARQRNPGLGAVLIIDKGDEEQATGAMRRGVADFQHRPVNADKAAAVVLQALERQRLAAELLQAHRRLELRYGLSGVVGDSAAMVEVLARARELAALELPILITGEEGTGRGLLARVIHQNSPRRGGPFVICDCAALPPRLAVRELFGPAGAGRGSPRPGRLELAHQGTLFLRRIGRLPKDVQARVAEVLQTGMLRPGLSRAPIEVRVRLIAASRTGLDGLEGEDRMHEGLHAQFREGHIPLPPLRHRRRDIPLLVRHALAERLPPGAPTPPLDAEALDLLEAYSWPGNVAELLSVVGQWLAQADAQGRLTSAALPAEIRRPQTQGDAVVVPLGSTLAGAEKRLILETMRMTQGNREKAARILGMSLRTLYRKLGAYGVDGAID